MNNNFLKKCSLLLLSMITLSSCGLDFFDIVEDISSQLDVSSVSSITSLDTSEDSSVVSTSEVSSSSSESTTKEEEESSEESTTSIESSSSSIDSSIEIPDFPGALSVDEAINKVTELGLLSGETSSEGYYIQGEVTSSTYSTSKEKYTLYLRSETKEKALCIESAVVASSIDLKDYSADNALKGATIVIYGYLYLRNTNTILLSKNSSSTIYPTIYSITNDEKGIPWVNVEDIDIIDSSIDVSTECSNQINYSLVPSNAHGKGWQISFESLDPSIARVNSTGAVIGVSLGTTSINIVGTAPNREPINKQVSVTVLSDLSTYSKIASYDFSYFGKDSDNKTITSSVTAAGLKGCASTEDPLKDIIANNGVSGTNVYSYYDRYQHLGLKLGTSVKTGELNLILTTPVKRVTLKAVSWKATDTFDVNHTMEQCPGIAYNSETEEVVKELTYAFEESTKEIVITANMRGFIQGIEFYEGK